MTIDEIRAAYRAEPFEPFRLRLTDGREFAVPSRMCIGLDPTGRRVVIALPEDAFEIIDLNSVQEIHALRPSGRRNGRRAKPSGRTTKKKKKQ